MTARRSLPAVLVLLAAFVASEPLTTSRVVAQSAAVDPVLYSGMQWRSVGPARGGRSIAVGGSDARPNEYWFGAVGGGAWKTTDGGTSWAPMTDGPHWVELDWQAAASPTAKNGSLTFWLDGVQKESLSKIDNDTRRIDSVQLGAVFGIDTGTRGVYYFDAFEAHQQQPIGQAANGAAAALAEAGVTDTVLLEADVPLTLSTTALQSNADTLVSAQVDGLQVHISFTANTVVEPAIALILRSDNTTIPDGYRVLATPFRVELQAVNGVALTTDGPPFVVTLAYGELVDPTPPNRELALQRWNAATESWESMPATLNAADQTIMAALEQPATLALFEQEEASVQQIYLPIIQQ